MSEDNEAQTAAAMRDIAPLASEQSAAAPAVPEIEYTYCITDYDLWDGVEAVRRRPGMYIGDTGIPGLHQLFKEIIDNAIDEVLAGHCDRIHVTLGKDRSIAVADNGRGIPVEIDAPTGSTPVEWVMTRLHDRSFHNDGCKSSGGLHGVGAWCVNALSEWMETTVREQGKMYRIGFARGEIVAPLAVVGACGPEEHGTTQRWLADRTIFADALTDAGELDYQPELLTARMRELAYLNKEVAITFVDALNGAEPVVFHHPRSIAEYIPYLNEDEEVLHPEVMYICEQHADMQIEIALQYNRSDQSKQARIYAFTNNIPQRDGGTHVTGFKTALTRVLNRYARKNGLVSDAGFSGDAIRAGLTAVLSLRLTNPLFGGSDRNRLMNPELEGVVNRVAGKGISRFLEANPVVARTIVGQATAARAQAGPE